MAMTLEELREFLKSNDSDKLSAYISQIDTLTAKMKELGGTGDEWRKLSDAKKHALQEANNLAAGYRNLSDATNKAKKSNEGFKSLLGDMKTLLPGVGGAVATAFKEMGGQFKMFLGLGTETGRSIISPLAESGTLIAHLGKEWVAANKVMQDFARVQTTAREALVISGEGLKNNTTLVDNYPQTLRRMAAATGLTTQKQQEMAEGMKIFGSGAITASVDLSTLSNKLTGSITPAVAMATVMRGLGFDSREAANMAVRGFKEFGQSPEETIKQLGRVAAAAKVVGINTQDTTDQITQASSHLGIFGRGSADATNVWATFSKTLKDSHVPLKQAGEIISDVTRGIAAMSVQDRAFIGMMSGMMQGASALGGGLKLELAMRQEGGMEKNLDALTKSLQRFGGGNIITLEEAANNPQLEMQFQIQRQMLGKLAGVTTQEKQNRVLEVLQGVQRGGMTNVDGQKALKDTFAKGKTIQEQSLTALERIEQAIRLLGGGRLDRKVNRVDKALRGGFRGLTSLGTSKSTFGREFESAKGGKVLEDTAIMTIRAFRAMRDKPNRGVPGIANVRLKQAGTALKNELNMGKDSKEMIKMFQSTIRALKPEDTRIKIKPRELTTPLKQATKLTLPWESLQTKQAAAVAPQRSPATTLREGLRQIDDTKSKAISSAAVPTTIRQTPAVTRDREMNKILTAVKSTTPVRAETIPQDITSKFKGALGDDTATASAATPGKVSVTPATVSSSTVIIKIEGGIGTEQVKEKLMNTLNNWAFGMA